MILLPFLAIAIWAGVFRRRGWTWLVATTAAFVAFGVAISVFTELQSLLGALTYAGSAAAWGIALVAGLVAWRTPALLPPPQDDDGEGEGGRIPRPVLAGIGLILVLTLLTALVAPPNSYDAMTYHLTRVEQWAMHRSLAPYATFDTRQLFMPSWSEYAMLQFRLLSGGDHFANLVQWMSFAMSCGGAALLATALGGGCTARNVAALLVATLPMAIAQASGTQTDVVAACWAVIACAYGYRLLAHGAGGRDLVLCVVAIGLAAATKQTALLFALAGLIPLGVLLIMRRRIRDVAILGVAAAAAIAVLAGPQLLRNYRIFGRLQGDAAFVDDAAMATHTPGAVACTTARNLALHFGTPIGAVNDAVATAVASGCQLVGANPDDPRTTWNPRFIAAPWTTHEESAPNPLQLLLLVGCVIGLLRVSLPPRARWFSATVLLGMIVFSAALKWQSYNSRLETPFFVLGLAWAAVVLEHLALRWRRLLLWVMVLAALPFALVNYTRPLIAVHSIAPRPSILAIPREYGYFMYQPAMLQPYRDVAQRIATSKCTDVAMHTWPDGWEYAVMALVRDARRGVRFRAVGALNQSAGLEKTGPRPCLLLQIWPGADVPPKWAADWSVVTAWNGPANAPGIALFRPPAAPPVASR
ncbi:MAG: hypothetical protein ACREL5_03575 [Gemmatimonadales bacterium]